MRATQLKIQASSACAGDLALIEEDAALGLRCPTAIIPAVTSRVLARSSAGSCHWVMACRSTTQKMHA